MIELLKNILQFIADCLSWVIDFFEWCVVKVFVLLFDAIVALLALIPVPDWLTNLASNVTAIDSGILFFMQPLQVGTGISWIFGAYLLRFLIRRLPVVG